MRLTPEEKVSNLPADDERALETILGILTCHSGTECKGPDGREALAHLRKRCSHPYTDPHCRAEGHLELPGEDELAEGLRLSFLGTQRSGYPQIGWYELTDEQKEEWLRMARYVLAKGWVR